VDRTLTRQPGLLGFAQPADYTLGASVSVNLPFSRLRHRGEIEAARATRTEAELQLHSTQLKVKGEVRDAYSRYEVSFGSHQTLTLASVDLDPEAKPMVVDTLDGKRVTGYVPYYFIARTHQENAAPVKDVKLI
jgi:hypothetical protein